MYDLSWVTSSLSLSFSICTTGKGEKNNAKKIYFKGPQDFFFFTN